MSYLTYEKQICSELVEQDGLTILSNGLNITRILYHLINIQSTNKISFVINLNKNQEALLLNYEVGKINNFKSITSDNSNREDLYIEGGCFSITSRILIIDLLTNKIPIHLIHGILIANAHTVTSDSSEGFILRIFRRFNKVGFIRAITDNPYTLTGNKVENLMKLLYVKKLFLWPRFHLKVIETLKLAPPKIIEIKQDMSENMKGIQICLTQIMASLLEQLRSCRGFELSNVNLESCLFRSNDSVLLSKLEPVWNKINSTTKNLFYALQVIRRLSNNLMTYDCVLFYKQLLTAKESNHSWLTTPVADKLFTFSKNRLYLLNGISTNSIPQSINDSIFKVTKKFRPSLVTNQTTTTENSDKVETLPVLELKLEPNSKWQTIKSVISEIENEIKDEVTSNENIGNVPTILVLCKSFGNCKLLKQILEGEESKLIKKYFRNFLYQLNLSTHPLANKAVNSWTQADLKTHGVSSFQKEQLSLLKELKNLDEIFSNEDSLLQKRKQSADDSQEEVEEFCILAKEKYNIIISIFEAVTLEQLKPNFVIFTEPNLTFIRQVEVYQCVHFQQLLKVYFIIYEQSIEQQKYLCSLRQEKSAFENLIKEKANMIISNDQDGKSDVSLPFNYFEEVKKNTRKGGKAEMVSNKVLVDMREFRSSLPNYLDASSLIVIPKTLSVGDYILAPTIAIERKSVSDLIQSLNSGHLYNQMVALVRQFPKPILLIEFDPKKSFYLQEEEEDVSDYINASTVRSKLMLLLLHFPQIRIIWSRSPETTVKYFQFLKQNQPEPDENAEQISEVILNDNTTPLDMLRKMPGVTNANILLLIDKINSLYALSKMSLQSLIDIIGIADGTKLYNFMHSKTSNYKISV